MKRTALLILMLITFNHLNASTTLTPFIEVFKFATVEEAKIMISSEDEYTNQWSEFDINSKFQKENGNKKALLSYAALQVQEWTPEEQSKIILILKKIQLNIEELGLQLKLPNDIYFIKTTAKEEGGASGYTRSNYIVLKDELISSPNPSLEHLVVHELFHVLSRHSSEIREKLYNIIGFKMMDQIIYPDNIKNLMLSNPDAPLADSYINLAIGNDTISCVMIIYAKRPYSGGSFFEYMNIGLLSLSKDEIKKPLLSDGNAVIYSIDEVDNFYEQVGKNTNYIINPEEILAENFTLLINKQSDLPSPWVVDEMLKILKK